MTVIDYLGKNFDSLGYPPDAYTEEHRVWLAEEGLPIDFAIQMKDRSNEFILNSDRVVTTVFIYQKAAIENLLSTSVAPKVTEQIKRNFGQPTTTGPERDVPILGKKGSWLRYDYSDYSMHIQMAVGSDAVEMLTLTSKKYE